MKNKSQPIILVYILGAHPNLPVNEVFNLSDYQGLKQDWGFK